MLRDSFLNEPCAQMLGYLLYWYTLLKGGDQTYFSFSGLVWQVLL